MSAKDTHPAPPVAVTAENRQLQPAPAQFGNRIIDGRTYFQSMNDVTRRLHMVGHRHNRRKYIMDQMLSTDPRFSKIELWEAKENEEGGGFRLMERRGGDPITSDRREFIMGMDRRISKIMGGNVVIFNGDKLVLLNSNPDDFNTAELQISPPYEKCGCWVPIGNMSGGVMDVTHMVAIEGQVDATGSKDNDQLNYVIGMARLIGKELYSQRDDEIKNIDPLTNLWNKRFLKQVLFKSALASIVRKRPFTIAFIDLDDFKALNDTYGHNTVDEALGDLGSRFRSEVGGFSARFGGEEFVLLSNGITTLPNLERHGAYLHGFFSPLLCRTDCGPLEVRASIGVIGSFIWQELKNVRRFPTDFKQKMMDGVITKLERMKALRQQCDADLKRLRRQRKAPETAEGPVQEYAKNWGELLLELADIAMYFVKVSGKDGVAIPYAKNGELSFRPII